MAAGEEHGVVAGRVHVGQAKCAAQPGGGRAGEERAVDRVVERPATGVGRCRAAERARELDVEAGRLEDAVRVRDLGEAVPGRPAGVAEPVVRGDDDEDAGVSIAMERWACAGPQRAASARGRRSGRMGAEGW